MENSERRQFPRIQCTVAVDYITVDSGSTVPYATASRNISQGGICLILFDKITPGQILDMTFLLPDTFESIKARGKISWVSNLRMGNDMVSAAYEAGIEFLDISDENRAKITHYITKQKT